MDDSRRTIVMEGVTLVQRNFTGKEGKYNKEGQRNFLVLLDDDAAEQMAADDWNVKWFAPREEDEGETGQAFLPVELRYDKGRPPKVVQITSRGRTNLEEHELADLDYVDILNVDMVVRASHWETPDGRSGEKAYLQSIFITIEEDPLEAKYADLPRQ